MAGLILVNTIIDFGVWRSCRTRLDLQVQEVEIQVTTKLSGKNMAQNKKVEKVVKQKKPEVEEPEEKGEV